MSNFKIIVGASTTAVDTAKQNFSTLFARRAKMENTTFYGDIKKFYWNVPITDYIVSPLAIEITPKSGHFPAATGS